MGSQGAQDPREQPSPLKDADARGGPTHVNIAQIEWTRGTHYPEAVLQSRRYKPLIGGYRPNTVGVPHEDVRMGALELEPRAAYPGHFHPAPEIYYVVSGKAMWTVGEETFLAEPGTAVYHAPNTVHAMVNTGDEPVFTVYFWWAPDGNRDVLQTASKLMVPLDSVPER